MTEQLSVHTYIHIWETQRVKVLVFLFLAAWHFTVWINQNLFKQFPVTQEKAMAPHSSTLAWKIPWMEEPGRLQSMGSLGVGHD